MPGSFLNSLAEQTEALKGRVYVARMADCRTKLISTDGVFSMDGTIAELNSIFDLVRRTVR